MKRSLLMSIVCLLASNAFSQPVVDATLSANEYGTSNAYTAASGGVTWYLTWDNTNLYVLVNGANMDETGVLYFDFDAAVPVNSDNGVDAGFDFEDITATLPFNADAVLFFNNSGRELHTATTGWSGGATGWGTYADDDNGNGAGNDDIREFSIPWTSLGLGVAPASLNFTAYMQYRFGAGSPAQNGGVYGQLPPENPTPTTAVGLALEPEMVRYYTVTNVGSAPAVSPFANNSYTHIGADITGMGAISVYDFTMNSAGASITRGSGASGNWAVTGSLVINDGTIDFGATTSTCTAGNLQLQGGVLELSSAAGGNLTLTGDWNREATATFTSNGRSVIFNGTNAQTVTLTGGGTETFDGFTINNSAGVAIAAGTNLTINDVLTFTDGKLNVGGNTLTLNGDIAGSSSTNCITLDGTSDINIGGTGTPTGSLFFDQTMPNVTNRAANFTVNRSGGSITLGDSLQVTGVVTHTDGTLASTANAFLKLKATGPETYGQIAGTGSGSITGNVYAEYQINGAGKWRQICSPFTGNTLADLEDDLNLNYGTPDPTWQNVFYLDESLGGAGNPGAWQFASSSQSMDALGYAIYIFSEDVPAIIDLEGTYVNGDYVTEPLSVTGVDPDTSGYHLIRNPWPSNYQHQFTITNLLSNTIYVYEGNTVRDHNGITGSLPNGVVPPFHAIMVSASVLNSTLTFPNSSRTTINSANYMDKTGLLNYVALKVTNPNGEWDETRVYTDDNAQNGKDYWDANKILNYPVAPSIYSLTDGKKTSINLLNHIPAEGISIPVQFATSTEGVHMMDFTLENITPGYDVLLEDAWTGKTHDVSKGPYTFTHQNAVPQERFVLHFRKKSGTASTAEELAANTVFAGSNGNTVTLACGSAQTPCTVEVLDMMGRTLKPAFTVDFNQTPVYTFPMQNVAAGYYLVRVTGQNIAYTGKVFLQ